MSASPQPIARLLAPADAENLALCRLALNGAVSHLGVSDSDLDELKLLLSETCAAAIRNGIGEIDVEFRTRGSELEVSVAGGQAAVNEPAGLALLNSLATRWTAEPGRLTFARVLAT